MLRGDHSSLVGLWKCHIGPHYLKEKRNRILLKRVEETTEDYEGEYSTTHIEAGTSFIQLVEQKKQIWTGGKE